MTSGNSLDSGRRLCVLQVLPTFNPRYGGPVAAGAGISRSLNAHGIDVRLASADGEADPASFSPEQFDSDNSGRWGYCFRSRLFPIIRRLINESDVVHVHGMWNFPASLAAKMAVYSGIPYVVSPHGMLTRWSLGQSVLKKRVYSFLAEQKNVRRASALHFFSEEEASTSERWGSHARTVIIPNGVDAQEYDRRTAREEIGKFYPELIGKTLILFLGRLHPGKGIDLLVPAFGSLCSEFPAIRLVIAGPNAEYSGQMFELIRRFGIADRVMVTGLVTGERKRALLWGSDIFVLPSRHEGDSISIKEALLAGLPIVITPQCNFALVEDANVGTVVELTIEGVTNGIRMLLVNPGMRTAMGFQGSQLIRDRFTWDCIGRKFSEVYRELIDQRGARFTSQSPKGKNKWPREEGCLT